MTKHIDEKKWDQSLQYDDWYLRIWDELSELHGRASDEKDKDREEIRDELRDYFGSRLRDGKIPLAKTGENLDEQRKPIDTVIIHHTSNKDPYSLELLNTVHFLNLYVMYYGNPTPPNVVYFKGKPIWSNHIRDGKQVFWAYHWLVRRTGEAVRLLNDEELGWHAGDWDINCRSVAICLDNDYEEGTPSDAELDAVAKIIKEHYPSVAHDRILGHREVNPKAIGPGNRFLGGWKADLIKRV